MRDSMRDNPAIRRTGKVLLGVVVALWSGCAEEAGSSMIDASSPERSVDNPAVDGSNNGTDDRADDGADDEVCE